jgi:hypothetical protein
MPKTGGVGICTCGTTDGATTGVVEMIACGTAGSSVELTTGVPHRLQNTDSGGTRLPHREQKEPIGSVVVSTGRGIAGTDSTIFLMGLVISIFFFGEEATELTGYDGVAITGFC